MNQRVSLTQQIYDDLKDKILSSHFIKGRFIPTEQELMQIYNVSRGTLRTALKMLKEEGLLVSLYGKGWQVCDFKKPENEKKTIAFIGRLDDSTTIFLDSIRSVLDSRYTLETFFVDTDVLKKKKNLLKELCDCSKLAGVIVFSELYLPKNFLKELNDYKIPFGVLTLQDHCDYDTYANDRGLTSQLAVEHLLKHGHKNILYISAKTLIENTPSYSISKFAYESAMKIKGLEPLCFINDINAWDRSCDEDAFLEEWNSLKKAGKTPTAIYAEMENMNENILRIFSRMDISVPKDVSMISTGDGIINEKLKPYGFQKFTVIKPDLDKIARLATDKLISRIEGQQTPFSLSLTKPVVIKGESVSKITINN